MTRLGSRNFGSHLSSQRADKMLAARAALNTLLKRCVECPVTTPSCPSCPDGQTCSLIPQSCDACASTVCVRTNQFAGQVGETKSATPTGPIVGGALGGVAAILVAVFCLWYFYLRTRKRKDTWDPPEKRDQATLARNGTRTHSIASTVLTRASNVIQIAYIPGVTGRSPPVSPSIPPPMPNISAANTANSTPQPDTHFFMADDLRNSTWSDTSIDPRISLAPSLARASSATTVYYENAMVPPVPAQHAFRAQANMVSVKQTGSSGTSMVSANPHKPSPLAQGGQIVKPIQINNSSIVARNVTARPIEVKKTGSANRVPTLANLARANPTKSAATASTEKIAVVFEEKEVARSPATNRFDSPVSPPSALRPRPSDMSFGAGSSSNLGAVSPSEGPLGRQVPTQRPDSGGLTAMIEDAIKSASADTRRSPRPGAQRKDSGPFSDVHELPDSMP